jgi:cytochrome c556
MSRIVLSALVGVLGVSVALAEPDPIAERKKLMKENGAATRLGTQMARGERPFDLAKAKEIFATYETVGQTFPNLFPDDSRTGGDTAAAPKIWEDMAGFKERAAKLASDARQATRSVQDLASFNVALQDVTKNCNACHQTYRINKS